MSALSRKRRAWVRHMGTDEFYKAPGPIYNEGRWYVFRRGDITPREKYGKKCLDAIRRGESLCCPECWFCDHPEERKPKAYYKRYRKN